MKNADRFITLKLGNSAPQHNGDCNGSTVMDSGCDRCTLAAMLRLFFRSKP